MKNKEQAVINLVINGEQAKSTLKEVSGAYNALKAEISNMRKADDPKAYAEKIELLKKLGAAQKSVKDEMFSGGEAAKKFSADFKGAIGEATGKLGPFGGMVNTFFGYFSTGQSKVLGVIGTVKSYVAALDTAKEAQLAAVEANQLAEAAMLALAAGTGTEAAAEAAKTTAILAGTVATKAAAEATNILKMAFASTGIGALVLALGFLITYFTQTNEGAKKIKIGLGALSDVFQQILKLIAPLGKAIFDAFAGSNWNGIKLATSALNTFLIPLRTIINVISDIKNGNIKAAFLDINEGVKDFAKNQVDGFKAGIGFAKDLAMNTGKAADEIKKTGVNFKAAAMEGATVVEERFKLAAAERAWSTEKIKQQQEVDVLTMKIRQQTLSESERIALAEKAKGLKDKIFQKDKEYADSNLALVLREQDAMSKKDKQAITDAKNRVATVEAEHATSMQNIVNRESKLQMKQQAAREAAEAKRKKDAEELEKLLLEAESAKIASLARQTETLMDAYGKELSATDEYYRQLIYKQQQNSIRFPLQKRVFDQQIIQLENEKNAKLIEISDKFRKDDLAKLEKIQKEFLQLTVDGIQDREAHDLAALKVATDEKLKAIDKESKDTQGLIDRQIREIVRLKSVGKESEAQILQESVTREMEMLDASGKLRAEFILRQTEKETKIKLDAANKKAVTSAQIDIVNADTPASKLQAELDLLEAKHNADISNEKLTAEEKILINDQYQKDKKTLEESYGKQAAEFAIKAAGEITSAAFTIMAQGRQANTDAHITDINKNRDAELSNKSLTEAQKKAINDKYDKQVQAEKVKAFKANQIASIEQALINGALAVTMAMGQTGILAPFVVPGIIAATLAQVAVIAAQKPPKAKKGMIIPQGPSHEQGGMNITNNQTGEVVAEMEGDEPVLILRKDLPEENLELIKQLAFSNTYDNPANVDSTSVNKAVHMAKLGAFYTPNQISTPTSATPPVYESNSTKPDNMELLLKELILATKEEKNRPIDLNYRLVEQFQDRLLNIKNEVNS